MSDSVFSFLEFGAIDPQGPTRQTWDFAVGQKAYDWLMVARYLNDLVGYQTLSKTCAKGDLGKLAEIYNAEIHHLDDASINLNKLTGLSVIHKGAADEALKFLEFGSTIFGCIEGIRFCQDYFSGCSVDVKYIDLVDVEWHGIDNSPMMNSVAAALHQMHKVFTYEALDETVPQCDLFFAKGVSMLYQVRSVDEFLQMISRARLSIFDYSLSLTGERDLVIGTGKNIRYLGLTDAVNAVEALDDAVMMVRLSNTRVDHSKGRLFFDAAFGEPDLVEAYIEEDKRIRGEIESKTGGENLAKTILHLSHSIGDGWVGLREYCETQELL